MSDHDRATNDTSSPNTRTGAGAEAAEGIHGTQQPKRDATDRSSLEGRSSASDNAADRQGSEPLEGRTEEHVGGYGGKGGAPRTSSDKREQPKDGK